MLRLYAQFVARRLDLGDAIMALSMVCIYFFFLLTAIADECRLAESCCALCLQPSTTMDWVDISFTFRRTSEFMHSSLIFWVKPLVGIMKTSQAFANNRASHTDFVFDRYNGTCVWAYGILPPDAEAFRHK
jgi:hypothetical protein